MEHEHISHDHDHLPLPETDYRQDLEDLEIAVRTLLLEKGLISSKDIQRLFAEIDTRTPMAGARLVAHSWVNAEFKNLLLNDSRKALLELLQVEMTHGLELSVVENTDKVHHVVVCTLCSCYPKAILGMPPAWYKSFAYRSRMVSEPREMLKLFGTTIPDHTEIRVVDSTSDLRYLVLPVRPKGTEGWNEEQLIKWISRDSMIGVTLLPEATC